MTQCYDGGVSRAMDNISKLLPEIQHFVLYSGSENPAESGQYSGVRKFSANPLKRFLEVRAYARELEVEVIHAHSSWAGLYSRAFRPSVPVIYEPHCYVFDDPQRHPLLRSVYRRIESFLSRHTTITVALTEHERGLAYGLDKNAKVRILPNIPTIPTVAYREDTTQAVPEIVMIGRLAPQKDPGFYQDLARLSSARGLPFKFVWIGSGTESDTDALQAAGIEVTGWLAPEEISQRLSRAWMYVHSAHYEGFPLSVLDAAAAKVPIIVRDLPCFEETQLTKVEDPEEAIATLAQAYFDPDFFASTKVGGQLLLQTMNTETHTDVLTSVYRDARIATDDTLVGTHS
ncbi:hypothetical protein AS189_16415 [Arthrobacter alpinus]|uniref:D-inositol 3-phosphate glycosyltransferase n=1 Tax=Arthrobacter alpinus TaxID=656366 RepID=A0A0S2M2G0_9MICC|nr:glycosyltransferase [Arthrobacter alpinus]ALO67772.1 hypothetical protein AS189_16415 [Arthrobacter alpinus]